MDGIHLYTYPGAVPRTGKENHASVQPVLKAVAITTAAHPVVAHRWEIRTHGSMDGEAKRLSKNDVPSGN